MIAVLFADRRGIYAGRPDVDLWDVRRDARRYPGPHPVVAHPPCSRWCRLAGLVEARWSHLDGESSQPTLDIGLERRASHAKGDDNGAFASALASVRRWRGVLEHPAYSDAWDAYGLPRPNRDGGWTQGACGGWSAHVEQGRYGHAAKKATWLYAYGVEPPELLWGFDPEARSKALVSWCGNHVSSDETRPRVGKKSASATPPAFAELLLSIARSAINRHESA